MKQSAICKILGHRFVSDFGVKTDYCLNCGYTKEELAGDTLPPEKLTGKA